MNSGIAISFIIGGLLLISVISMNSRIIENSGETVLNMTAKKTVETISQVMTRDFLRIGFNTEDDPQKAIIYASNTKITFEADINDNSTEDPVTITWEIVRSNTVTATENPHDYQLIRHVSSGPEQGRSTFTVVANFENKPLFTFRKVDGDKVAMPPSLTGSSKVLKTNLISSIEVYITCEAPVKYGNRSDYEKSIWSKTFTPPNLNFGAYNLNN